MVIAREGDDVAKVQLAPRLQEAIDEAAMRLGDTGSDEYLAGWTRSAWTSGEGDATTLAERTRQRLESDWSAERISEYLDSLTS